MNRPLRVLVCSGNLGNALPDPDSIAAWLPNDGNYDEVVQNPHYPLPDPQECSSLLEELDVEPIVSNKRSSTTTVDRIDEEEQDDDDEHNGDTNNHNTTTNNVDSHFDIIVIGMQEATFSVEDEDGDEGIKKELSIPVVDPLLQKAGKTLQKTAEKGISTVTTLTASADHTKEDTKPFDWLKAKDSSILMQLLAERLPSYDFAIRFQRGEMRLEVLVRRDLECTVLSVRAQNTGLVNLAANKGGIVGELLVGGTTRVSFCTAHLEAHEGLEKYQHRCQMLTDIFGGTADDSFPGVKYDLSLKSHYCFVLGDLNFRTEMGDDLDKQEHRAQVDALIEAQDWRGLNKGDELFRALRQKDMAVGFQTLPCYFPPTFKVLRQDGFTYIENRRPSYTDRILWKCGDGLNGGVQPKAYGPIEHFTTSDHKPIRGAFEIDLNPHVKLREPRMMPRRHSLFHHMPFSGSTRNLFGGHHRDKYPLPRQTLHIFISNLQCQIKKKQGLDTSDHNKKPISSSLQKAASIQPIQIKPDPFLAFVSYPKRLVKEERSTWQRFQSNFRPLVTKTSDDGKTTRTADGWPRTKLMTATYEPDWSEEEIHLKVKSHNKDGVPLDHTGALLYFTLFNAAGLDYTVIGTFAMNLGNLCATARSARRSRLRGRSSVYLKDDCMAEMTMLEIKEPLLKNGRETGFVQCDIDAVWLDDNAAPESVKNVKTSIKQKRKGLRRLKT